MNSYLEIICEVAHIHIFILKGFFLGGQAKNVSDMEILDYENMNIPCDLHERLVLPLLLPCLLLYCFLHIT